MYKLQWAFLEAKARKTLHEQEKQAMVSAEIMLSIEIGLALPLLSKNV
jgi:hypothetical protein